MGNTYEAVAKYRENAFMVRALVPRRSERSDGPRWPLLDRRLALIKAGASVVQSNSRRDFVARDTILSARFAKCHVVLVRDVSANVD